MQYSEVGAISGHVFRVERKRGPAWYAKYRLPDGRQVQRRIGPAWTGRGRPAAGYVGKRGAEDWLRQVLDEARAGTLPGMVPTGVTLETAALEWLRYCVEGRACKPSTMRDYRRAVLGHLIPRFGDRPVEDVSAAMIEAWLSSLRVAPRTKNKLLTSVNGVFRRAQKRFGLQRNPVVEIERLREPGQIDLEVFSPEEVMALVRAAKTEQDAAIFLTAAFTGRASHRRLAIPTRVGSPTNRVEP